MIDPEKLMIVLDNHIAKNIHTMKCAENMANEYNNMVLNEELANQLLEDDDEWHPTDEY